MQNGQQECIKLVKLTINIILVVCAIVDGLLATLKCSKNISKESVINQSRL